MDSCYYHYSPIHHTPHSITSHCIMGLVFPVTPAAVHAQDTQPPSHTRSPSGRSLQQLCSRGSDFNIQDIPSLVMLR